MSAVKSWAARSQASPLNMGTMHYPRFQKKDNSLINFLTAGPVVANTREPNESSRCFLAG